MKKILIALTLFVSAITCSFAQVDTISFFEVRTQIDTMGKVEFTYHRNNRFSNLYYGMGYLVVENAILQNSKGLEKKSPKYYYIQSPIKKKDKYFFWAYKANPQVTIQSNPKDLDKNKGWKAWFTDGINIVNTFAFKEWQ